MTGPLKYPEITALRSVIRKHALRIKALAPTKEETDISYRRLVVKCGGKEFIVPVDDEYEDVAHHPDNPALMLHLVLSACVNYEEAEDFLVWSKEAGLPPGQPGLQQIHFELRASAPLILKLINGEAQPLSHWDFSMNTGVAIALRALTDQ